MALRAIFRPTVYHIIISFRPYFLGLLVKLMRANLAIKSLTGASLQLSMCSLMSGIPLFGGWVNLFSRNSYSLCSHFLSHHFKHCSNTLPSTKARLTDLWTFLQLSFLSRCSVCPSLVPQDFPVL